MERKIKFTVSGKYTLNRKKLTLEAWRTDFKGLLVTKDETFNAYFLTHFSTGLKATRCFAARSEAFSAAKIMGPLINWSVRDGAAIMRQCSKLSDVDAQSFADARQGRPYSKSISVWKRDCKNLAKTFMRDLRKNQEPRPPRGARRPGTQHQSRVAGHAVSEKILGYRQNTSH